MDLRAVSRGDASLSSALFCIPEKNFSSVISMSPQNPFPLPVNRTHRHQSPVVPRDRNASPISLHIYVRALKKR